MRYSRSSCLRAIILAAVVIAATQTTATAEPVPERRAASLEYCLESTHLRGHRFMHRFSGADRYETGVCPSRWTWHDHDAIHPPVAGAVVLARGDLYADALAGGPLAGYLKGPLLLNPPQALLPAVKAEIQRVLAPGGTVYLLGSTGALSAAVESELVAAGFTTKRLAGQDRFQTAIRVAQELPSTNQFFLATGTDFPDALPAGAYGATHNYRIEDPTTTRPFAVLFTDGDVMPAATRAHIDARKAEHRGAILYAAGGAANTAAIRTYGASAVRSFVGVDRFDTAALIAERLYTDADGKLVGDGVGIANGLAFPDALAGTTELMLDAQPLLLTPPTTLAPVTSAFLHNHAPDLVEPETGHPYGSLDIFGGTAAVSTGVANEAIAAFMG